jgi:hypothetical protein
MFGSHPQFHTVVASFTIWSLWKEQNAPILKDATSHPFQVALVIVNDMSSLVGARD